MKAKTARDVCEVIDAHTTMDQIPQVPNPTFTHAVSYEQQNTHVRSFRVPLQMISMDDKREEESSLYSYTPPNLDVLYGLDVHGTLPAIEVKPEFEDTIRIAWCRYPAHYAIRSIEMEFATVGTVLRMTSNLLTIFSQKHMGPTFTEIYDRRTGNVPELLEFSNALPAFNYAYSLPFNFCLHRSLGLPLFLHQNAPVRFVVEMDQNPSRFLRMQHLDPSTNTWKSIQYNPEFLNDNPKNNLKPTLSPPTIKGEFSNLMSMEKERRIEEIRKRGYQLNLLNFYIDESTERRNEFSGYLNKELQDSLPSLGAYWMVQRYEDLKCGNQTCFVDEEGRVNLHASQFMLPKGVPLTEKFNEETMDLTTLKYNRCVDRIPGIWMHAFAPRIHPLGGEPCLPFQNDQTSLHLKDMGVSLEVSVEDRAYKERIEKARIAREVLQESEPICFLYTYLPHFVKVEYRVEPSGIHVSAQLESKATVSDWVKNQMRG